MNTVKSSTPGSMFTNLLNLLGITLLTSAGISVVLVGIVLLLSWVG